MSESTIRKYRIRRPHPGSQTWKTFIENHFNDIAAIAVSIGLLGSVYAFLAAFSGFQGGVDVERITNALSLGYATTLVGLTQSIMATVCCYMLGLAKT